MRLYLHHLYSRETQILEGTEQELDTQLAELFPEQAVEVDPDEEGLTELIDHINHEVQGVDIEMEELESLEKAQTTPDFPRLGIQGNRRETPYVTQAKGVETKQKLMAAISVRTDPDYQDKTPGHRAAVAQRYHKQNQNDEAETGAPRGAVTGAPGHTVSYVRAGPQMLQQEGGFHTSFATKNHEDFHQMMKQVELKHGVDARRHLASNLLKAIPIQYRSALEQYQQHMTGDIYKQHIFKDEETLARLFNWLNSPKDRPVTVSGFRQVQSFDIRMKRALRSLRAASQIAHQQWLTPNFIKSELPDPKVTAMVPAPVAKKPRVKKNPDAPSLVAIHNISHGGVLHAHTLGGLAAPSLAITHKDHPLEGFGDISLIANHHLIDPEQVPVYESDIYSPRHPRAKFRTNEKEARKIKEGLEPYFKRLGEYHGNLDDLFERGGPEEVVDHHNLKHVLGLAYLESKGKRVEPKMKPKNLRHEYMANPVMQAFRNDPSIQHDRNAKPDDESPYYKQFSDTAKRALRSWADELSKQGGEDQAFADDLFEHSYNQHWNQDTGLLHYGPWDSMYQDMHKVGQQEPDSRGVRDDVEQAMKDEDPEEFRKWALNKLRPMEGGQYIPKMSASGNWRKIPYNLYNVLKEMTRTVRQGENFHYGLGTARAAGSKRFKNIEQMVKHRHKIVSKEQFETQKKVMDERYGQLVSKLSGYHPNGGNFGMYDAVAEVIGESYKRGKYMHNELKQSGFVGVPLHVQQELQQFSHDLLNMPTEYFEAKPQRAVQFNEFRGAAVPVGTPAEVIKILRDAGLQIEHYKKNDSVARRLAIQKVVGDHQLLLSEKDLELPRIRKIEAHQKPVPIDPHSSDETDPAYVYHGTNLERAHGIAEEGLHVHDPWEYTDQSTWPDGSTEKRNYHSSSLKGTLPFLPEERGGGYVVLRTPRAVHPFKREGTDDMYSQKTVPAQHIQILTNQGWHPVQSLTQPVIHKSETLKPEEYEAVEDQHGFRPHLHRAFAAARFLTGSKTNPDFALLRQNLVTEEGDVEAAALRTYNLPVTEQNLKALRAVSGFKSLAKTDTKYGLVVPGHPDALETAKKINQAISEGNIEPIKLGGVHSAGSLLVTSENGEHWLLKPGVGGPGPAAGAQEQPASDSRREAAFYHVAKAWGLGEDLPRADLVLMNGQEYAAMEMLAFDWKNLSKLQAADPQKVVRAIDRYRKTGQLHQWAMLDYILGNPDRHGQNEMVSPEGHIKLIDHGSAFAGAAFDPAHDKNSFVPYYLRASIDTARWKDMTSADRFRQMATAGTQGNSDLKNWLTGLDGQWADEIMKSYGVSDDAVQTRLTQVRRLGDPLDEGINRLWVTT